MALVVAELESRFTGDVRDFEQKAARVETRTKRLDGTRPTIDIDADVQDALAATDRAEAAARSVDGLDPEITVDADTSAAEDALDEVADKARDSGEQGGRGAGKGLSDGIVAALATIPIAGAVVKLADTVGQAVVRGFQDGLAVEVRSDLLAARTGLDEATVARLGAAAGEAYASRFGDSVAENMDAARLAVQSGLLDPQATQRDAQQIIESLSGVAAVIGEDIPRVTRSTSQLLKTGLARDASEAFDIIVAGQQAGLNVSEDWLDTLDEYSVQWQKLGLDGGQVLGLLSQGVRAGARDTDIAADALKEFSIRAIDDSALTREGFDAIGLSAEEMAAKIAAGGPEAAEALDATLDALRAIEDPVARNTAAVALFGTQAEDLGAALYAMDLDQAAREFDGLGGAASRALTTLGDNTAAEVEKAQRAIELAGNGIKGALAEAFAPQIEGFAQFVSENREAVVTFLFEAATGAIDFGRSLVEGAAAGTEAFGDFVGTAGPALLDLIEATIDGLDRIPFVNLGDAADEFERISENARASFEAFDEGSDYAAEAIRTKLIENGLDPAQEKLDGLGEGLIKNAALSDATNRLADGIAQVGYAADGSKIRVDLLDGSFDRSTESGRLLDSQVRAVRDGMLRQAEAAYANGEAQDDVRDRVRQARDAFIDQMEAMGLTQDQARALADEYGLIPKEVSTEANLVDKASDKARGVKRDVEAIPGQKSVNINATTSGFAEARAQINAIPGAIGVLIRPRVEDYPYVWGGPQRAEGGPVWPGETFLVGEEGPELVRFGQAGTVIPADETARIVSAPSSSPAPSGGGDVYITHYGGTDAAIARGVTRAMQKRALLGAIA